MSEQYDSPGFFDAFRRVPFPTQYPEQKTPVTQDVLITGWAVAFLTLFLSFFCVLPATKGKRQTAKRFLKVLLTLGLGLVIMECNYGQSWEVGTVRTNTAYRAGTGQEIVARVGLKLGLRSVNITLKAVEEPQGSLAGEKIDYNERFSWAWGQGRPGFGPLAGNIQREFREAQFRGSPLPILWVAEYFVIDGEGIRFGRHYRHAGWYAHMCVWMAFPLWIVTVILFKLVIQYGAQTLALTGGMLFTASLIWASHRNFIELQVPFADGVLTTHFGVHWYLSLVVGLACMLAGVIIYLVDDRYPDVLSDFFGNNPLAIVEKETGVEKVHVTPSGEMSMERMDRDGAAEQRVVTIVRSRSSRRYLRKMTYSSLAKHLRQGQQQQRPSYTYDNVINEQDEGAVQRRPHPRDYQQPGHSLPTQPQQSHARGNHSPGHNLGYDFNEELEEPFYDNVTPSPKVPTRPPKKL